MKKLLNTLYVTNPDYFLSRERDNVLIKHNGNTIRRFPIHILDNIICFNYTGVSPSIVQLANENNISISFHTPYGKFLGRFEGKTSGNVLLRRKQYRFSDNIDTSLNIAKICVKAKIINSRRIYLRLLRDHPNKINTEKINVTTEYLRKLIDKVEFVTNFDELRGIEGDAARTYFQSFDELILNPDNIFKFVVRSKRPPLNMVNALLSFLYSLLTTEIQSALESVGLDSYVGFYHTDRPGRPGLALDIIEEMRPYLVDRFVISLINRKQITELDFEFKENGAVLLNDNGRKKVLEEWQKRKHKEIKHPFLQEKIKIGLIPYVQALLFNRYLRDDIDRYPPFLF